MYSFEDLQEIAEKGLMGLELDREPSELFAPIRYLLSAGGKRIRPIITLMACNIFNDNVQGAVEPALALELFHNFTLIHDDIMDGADMRRGQDTVHRKWDTNTAILSGDALMVIAYEMLQKSDKNFIAKLLPVFNKVALEVCQGQQLDMNFEKETYVTEDEYIRMVELKTAALLAGCCSIGSICGGASETDQELMKNFGLNLGIAFQLQDDLLDSFGDTHVFGKKIGGDIIANKKTILLINALRLARGSQHDLLNSYLNIKEIDPEKKISGILAIYKELKVDEIAEELIDKHFTLSFDNLRRISTDDERIVVLENLANKMMARNS